MLKNRTKEEITGIIAAFTIWAVIIGALIWYMASHPAPEPFVPPQVIGTPVGAVEEAPDEQIHDVGQYYEIRAVYPSSVTFPLSSRNDEEVYDAQALMGSWIYQEIARFKDNSGLDSITPEDAEMFGLNDGRKYVLDIEYEQFDSRRTRSYVYQIYADTLGAHPNTYYRTFTFDATTGDPLHLDDLFAPGSDYLDILSRLSRAELPGIIAERVQVPVEDMDTDYIESGTLPIADSFQNFFIDGSTLVLLFPPYQVGPYVLGTVLLPIPLSELSSILDSDYRI